MSCLFLSFILLNPLRKKTAAYTWDMLHSWTGIDIHDLAGPKINAPENGIYMNDNEHSKFGSFMFYFDKDEVSNSYFAKPYNISLAFSPVSQFRQQVQSADGPTDLCVCEWKCNCRC